MLMVSHAVISTAISLPLNYPLLAFWIAFFVHFILDFIPHGDHEITKKFYQKSGDKSIFYIVSSLDLSLTLIFVLMLPFLKFSETNLLTIFAGIFGGLLPDILVGIYGIFKLKILKWFNDFHFFVHDVLNKNPKVQINFSSSIIIESTIMGFLFLFVF